MNSPLRKKIPRRDPADKEMSQTVDTKECSHIFTAKSII
jgi:hypothetical protein